MDSCEHKFVYLETIRKRENYGYNDHFERVDRFFCEKCLEYKDKEQYEFSRDKPNWY